ncbi:hypothetical protein MED121_21962 [Marinomonas sp. MED121]|uniref:YhdP family phospholipid transporter n=1 Tax=Marinomonas sp. MED121 TaxID=314277 RepID=UPI000068FDEB|nr:AsmA-like C-terminal region-containing protein [Marinomonas sp. MED121]EAQ65382.1 hypothetical protein MED121_21962 [Marinomonas sp. MED121]
MTDIIWWLAVSFVLILASLIVSVKLLLPHVDKYRQQIEINLSHLSGYNVKIDNISAKLEGLDPSIAIRGLSLEAAENSEPVAFERLMIRFNFWESVRQFEPKFSYIRFYNTKIGLSEVGGNWSLTGIESGGGGSADGFTRILNYFLDQRQISLLDTRLDIDSERVGKVSLSSDSMYLKRTSSGIGITANVGHQNYDDEFRFNAEIKGDLKKLNNLNLEAQLSLPEMVIMPSQLKALKEYKLSKLALGTNLWLSYSPEKDFSLVGDIKVSPMFESGDSLSFTSDIRSSYALNTKVLSAQFSNLIITKDERQYPQANLLLKNDALAQLLSVKFDHLDLGLGTKLALPYLNPAWFITKMLDGMQVKGEAKNGLLTINRESALSISYQGNLFIESSQGYRNIPKVDQLDAMISLQNDHGSFEFASNQSNLAFPLLYEDEWLLDGLAGRVNWGPSQDSFLVSSNNLYVSRNHADLNGAFQLESIKEGDDTLTLDVHADNLGVLDGVGYIPGRALPQSAHDWLDGALLSGLATSLDFSLSTKLVEKPDPKIEVNLDVVDAKVKFAPDWPVAEQVNANVNIDNQGIKIGLHQARVENVEGENLSVSLPLSRGSLDKLHLSGEISDDLDDVMGLLLQTNLANNVLKPFQSWQASGPATGRFKLILPLDSESKDELYLNLALVVKDAFLHIKDLDLKGEVAKGRFNYDSLKGIYDSNFGISAFSGQTTLDLVGDLQADGALGISGKLMGNLDLKEVMAWQNIPNMLTNAVQGKVDYSADFNIDPKQSGVMGITASSDLVGASLSLPPPFAKTKNLVRPIALNIDLVPEQTDISIKYDQKYRSKLGFRGSEFYGGYALIDQAELIESDINKGLSIEGQLAHIEVAAWRKLFSSEDSSSQSLRLDIPEWLSFVRLIADEVRLNEDNLLHNAKLEYDRSKALNDMTLVADELGVQLSKDLHGPVVNFSYLSWLSPVKTTAEKANSMTPSEEVIRAQQVPSMTLNIDELIVNHQPYGDWHLLITNLGKKIRIDPFSTELENGDFYGSIFWQDDEHSNVELSLNVEGENIDELTKKFSSDALLTSKKYSIDVNLSWLGTPFDIQRNSLTGRIDFSSENGVIEKINELPSFLKALGIFNIHALARRLTLDFSDVSDDGLTYDKISSLLSIRDGILNTDKPLSVISPTVEIEIKGKANLITETLDEKVIASFPLGNALPIAGLLLGVPQVAGILYITDKLFGSQLSKVTSVEYLIKGPFNEPIITPVIHTPKVQPKDRD